MRLTGDLRKAPKPPRDVPLGGVKGVRFDGERNCLVCGDLTRGARSVCHGECERIYIRGLTGFEQYTY